MSKPKPINVNGYDTFYTEEEDEIGRYFLICIPPHATNNMARFDMLNGYFIKQTSYHTENDVKFIKAYY